MRNATITLLGIAMLGCAVEIDGGDTNTGEAQSDSEGTFEPHWKRLEREQEAGVRGECGGLTGEACLDCADAKVCQAPLEACEADHGCPAFLGCMDECRSACHDDGPCVSECVAAQGGCLDLILPPAMFVNYLSCLCDSCAGDWLGAPACDELSGRSDR